MNIREDICKKALHYSALDRQIWNEELTDFVPKKIFDVHAHLWNNIYATSQASRDNDWCDYDTTMEDLQCISKIFFQGHKTHFCAFATPVKYAAYDELNNWVDIEVSRDPESYAAMLVTPEMTGEDIGRFIKQHPRFTALKPYHIFSRKTAPLLCDYLPEAQIEVADAYALAIVLHLPDDPERSLPELKLYTKKYPRIKWILAHCAASFQTGQLEKIIYKLCAMPNIWYDTAGITEASTFSLLLKHTDRKHIMFGTDNALIIGGCRRGRSLSGYDSSYSMLNCYKQLLALRQACEQLTVSSIELTDIFHNNARKLFHRSEFRINNL